jgi:hypothetical protein
MQEMTPFEVRVACYAGHRGEEEPRRIWFDHRCVDVAEILDRWLSPDHRYFKLRGVDGCVYIVRHDEGSGCWVLTYFARW